MAIWIEINEVILNKVSKLGWHYSDATYNKYLQLSPKKFKSTNRSNKPPVQPGTRLITEADLDKIILLRSMGMPMKEVFKTIFPKEGK